MLVGRYAVKICGVVNVALIVPNSEQLAEIVATIVQIPDSVLLYKEMCGF